MVETVKNKDLKNLNTFGIEARAACYGEFRTLEQLRELLALPVAGEKGWMVLGGGSNVLLTGDVAGMVIRPVADTVEILGKNDGRVVIKAGAGVVWDDFVAFCVGEGFYGAENLAAIPGTVGAAPIQNIGAYGVEAKDIITSVETYLPDNDILLDIPASECAFGYRDSIFKRHFKGRAVVLSVTFSLSLTPAFNLAYGDIGAEVEAMGGATLENVAGAVRKIRGGKLPEPKVIGNSGSFFKNPLVESDVACKLKERYPDMPVYTSREGEKLAAGWLIDKAGWKGYREGDAGVHEKQALVLVNYGNATGGDILALARKITEDVKNKFGVELEKEVNII